MSRIGKIPIIIPGAVKVSVSDSMITVEGGKGKLSQRLPSGIAAKVEEQEIREGRKTKKASVLIIERADDSRRLRALHGTLRSLAVNMIKGVTEGYQKKLTIVGVGYNVKLQGKALDLQVGFSKPVRYEVPEGIQVEVASPTEFTISGVNKQLVGEVASEIRDISPPEPYKGKGIRYADEVVRRKAGKAFVATE